MYYKFVRRRRQQKTKRTLSAERVSLYISVIALILSSAFTTYTIYQNSKTIETSQKAFQISIDSTIDIDFPTDNYGGHFSIRNTSSVDITGIKIFPICYYIKKEDEIFKIISRYPLDPVNLSVEILKPGEQSQVPLKAASCIKLPKNSGDYTNSLVVVFHRQTDNKRFVKIEPFTMSENDPNPLWASTIYSEGRWEGDAAFAIGLIQKIKETEQVFFRVDK